MSAASHGDPTEASVEMDHLRLEPNCFVSSIGILLSFVFPLCRAVQISPLYVAELRRSAALNASGALFVLGTLTALPL